MLSASVAAKVARKFRASNTVASANHKAAGIARNSTQTCKPMMQMTTPSTTNAPAVNSPGQLHFRSAFASPCIVPLGPASLRTPCHANSSVADGRASHQKRRLVATQARYYRHMLSGSRNALFSCAMVLHLSMPVLINAMWWVKPCSVAAGIVHINPCTHCASRPFGDCHSIQGGGDWQRAGWPCSKPRPG